VSLQSQNREYSSGNDSTWPRISIITPSFNQGNFIEQTILSVLDQNYPNLEYIIIDGGSTDDTLKVIKKYESRINYWISEPDSGQSDAINKGFQIATGTIINWLNSDDYLEEGALIKIANTFRKNSAAAITCTVRNFIENGETWTERTTTYQSSLDYLVKSFNNQPGTFFKKVIWDRYFPLPKQLHYTMDQYLWFCFWLEHSTSEFITESYISTNFRRHLNSKTTLSDSTFLYNTLGKQFFNEHHLIFWSFFEALDKRKANVLFKYFFDDFDYRSNQINFPATLKFNTSLIESVFQNYLLLLIKEDYKHGYFKRVKEGLTLLQDNLFMKNAATEISQLKRKIFFFPLIKAYRGLYWKLKTQG
jgi:glycosyltransferase involved in cell wall biosynthesis